MVKKLNRLEVQKKLKSSKFLVFTPREFNGIFGVSQNTASVFLSKNSRGDSSLFIKLRNNFYQLRDSSPSLYFIANTLYQPSYISLDKALAHHGIIPETIYAITSVTTKPTQEFETPRGIFTYQRIKREAYTGYSAVKLEGTLVHFAEAEKALADYLYFVDLKKRALNDRFDLRTIKKSRLREYAKLFGRHSLLELIDQVYAEYRRPRRIY